MDHNNNNNNNKLSKYSNMVTKLNPYTNNIYIYIWDKLSNVFGIGHPIIRFYPFITGDINSNCILVFWYLMLSGLFACFIIQTQHYHMFMHVHLVTTHMYPFYTLIIHSIYITLHLWIYLSGYQDDIILISHL